MASRDKHGVSALVGSHLDHSPMGGISQRQSESMTGSISRHQMVGSISQRFRGKHFIALAGEAFHGPCGGSIS